MVTFKNLIENGILNEKFPKISEIIFIFFKKSSILLVEIVFSFEVIGLERSKPQAYRNFEDNLEKLMKFFPRNVALFKQTR